MKKLRRRTINISLLEKSLKNSSSYVVSSKRNLFNDYMRIEKEYMPKLIFEFLICKVIWRALLMRDVYLCK